MRELYKFGGNHMPVPDTTSSTTVHTGTGWEMMRNLSAIVSAKPIILVVNANINGDLCMTTDGSTPPTGGMRIGATNLPPLAFLVDQGAFGYLWYRSTSAGSIYSYYALRH